MYYATCIKRFLHILETDLQKNKIRMSEPARYGSFVPVS